MTTRGDKLTPTAISVVVQGPIHGTVDDPAELQWTRLVLEDVRRALPGAELILSTWPGSDLRGLEFDRVLLSEDPGPVRDFTLSPNEFSNVNRQIVSTVAGIRASTRDYVLKLRTNTRLRHAGFLEFQHRFPRRAAELRMFEERILILDHYTAHPRRAQPRQYLFQPSDLVSFGARKDMLALWGIPLAGAWLPGLGAEPAADFAGKAGISLDPEQYIWISCLRKRFEVGLAHETDDGEALRSQSDLALVNNFVVLRRNQFGAFCLRPTFGVPHWTGLYTHREWRALYRRCCDSSAPVPWEWQDALKQLCFSQKLARRLLQRAARFSRLADAL